MRNNYDIRFKILDHLDKNGRSTEEIVCNEFLASLHYDLGTIKRTLIELIEKGYINESNVNWERDRETASVIFAINTKGDKTRKDTKRLLDINDIKAIRLYLTLDGKKFLIESSNLKRTTWMLKNEWWLRFAILIFGAILTLAIQGISKVFFSPDSESNHLLDKSVVNKENISKSDTLTKTDSTLKR